MGRVGKSREQDKCFEERCCWGGKRKQQLFDVVKPAADNSSRRILGSIKKVKTGIEKTSKKITVNMRSLNTFCSLKYVATLFIKYLSISSKELTDLHSNKINSSK